MSQTVPAPAAAGPDWADQTEQQMLDRALALAPRMGWTWPMVVACGAELGLSRAEVELLVPHGPADLAALLARRHDSAVLAALPDPAALKIRDRIRAAVIARLDAAAADAPAVRRWAAWLALPTHLPQALRLVWASADAL